jgi:NitT/TauT family transport system substrate-binding protein
MPSTLRIALSLVLALTPLVSSAATSATGSTVEFTLTTIQVGVLGYSDGTSLPVYAQGAGFFKKYGLDAHISSFNGGGAIVAAVAGGALDFGFGNVISVTAAIERGIPVIALTPAATFDQHEQGDVVLAKLRGSKLKSGADLIGKTVAVTTLSGTLQLAASAWIDQNGGDSKAVHFIELPNSEMVAALQQGRIDAAMLGEPVTSQRKADIEILSNAFTAIAPRWTEGFYVSSKAWVAANPDATHRFVQAMVEAARWANTHHTESANMLAPFARVDPSVFLAMTRAVQGDTLNAQLIQPPIDIAFKYGQIKAPYNAKDIVSDAQPYWRGVR